MPGVVAALAVALAGCGGGRAGAEGSTSQWPEPPSYSYTLDSQCGERDLIGRFRLTVVDGVVTRATGLDESAQRILERRSPGMLPTLRRLLDQVEHARRDGAAVATAEFDPVDGHPTKITIDHEANAIDDEECYTVVGYAVTPTTS